MNLSIWFDTQKERFDSLKKNKKNKTKCCNVSKRLKLKQNKQKNKIKKTMTTSSDSKKIVTVFGATGMQGGSVVDHLLRDDHFEVRGVTRDIKSEKSQK